MNPSSDNSFGGSANFAPVVSSGTGDVVLPTTRTKSKKGPLIVAIILFVIAAGAGVAAWVLSQQPDNSLATIFNNLTEYIENGTGFTPSSEPTTEDEAAEEETTSNTDLIYAITIQDYNQADIQNYYAGLQTRLNNFLTAANGKIAAETLNEYTEDIQILTNAINHAQTRNELISAYNNGGVSAAEEYYNAKIQCNRNTRLASICSDEEAYYSAEYDNHVVFAEAGCYIGDFYNMDCAVNYYGYDNYTEKLSSGNSASYYLAILSSQSSEAFLNLEIRKNNTEIKEALNV